MSNPPARARPFGRSGRGRQYTVAGPDAWYPPPESLSDRAPQRGACMHGAHDAVAATDVADQMAGNRRFGQLAGEVAVRLVVTDQHHQLRVQKPCPVGEQNPDFHRLGCYAAQVMTADEIEVTEEKQPLPRRAGRGPRETAVIRL